jgi:hypothetical protein
MADENEAAPSASPPTEEHQRNDDLASYLYVLGGIPALIAFFLIVFLLTGSCDQANVMIPA